MTINIDKRTKRFKRLFTAYQNHPYYNKIFELYLNDELKTVRQVNKYFRKIRITKKNTVHKRDIKTVNEIIQNCTAKKPVDRYQNCDQLQNDIIKLLN